MKNALCCIQQMATRHQLAWCIQQNIQAIMSKQTQQLGFHGKENKQSTQTSISKHTGLTKKMTDGVYRHSEGNTVFVLTCFSFFQLLSLDDEMLGMEGKNWADNTPDCRIMTLVRRINSAASTDKFVN